MSLSRADFTKALDDTTGALVPRPPIVATFPLLRTPDFLSDSPDPFERPCIGGASRAALAANNSILQLFNPTASGVVARVRFRVILGATGLLVLKTTQTILATAEATRFRNSGVSGLPACAVLSDHVVGVAGNTFLTHTVIADTEGSWGDFIVGPGFGLNVAALTVNVLTSAAFFWEEVPEGQP